MYDTFNNKTFHSVDVINFIIKYERTIKNNNGHITFISCRKFPQIINEDTQEEIKMTRANSLLTAEENDLEFS